MDTAVGELSPVERLLFIGCFSNADDEGRLVGSPAYLRSVIFPYDDFTVVVARQGGVDYAEVALGDPAFRRELGEALVEGGCR